MGKKMHRKEKCNAEAKDFVNRSWRLSNIVNGQARQDQLGGNHRNGGPERWITVIKTERSSWNGMGIEKPQRQQCTSEPEKSSVHILMAPQNQ